jgi:uncharacterized protein
MKGVEVRHKLHKYLDADPDFQAVFSYTKHRFQEAKHLVGHNWDHAYRDVINAIIIGEAEGANMSIVLPAAAMHDIGFLFGAASQDHGAVGADKLPEFLNEGGIRMDSAKIRHIADCIRTHKGNIHGQAPSTLEAKVVSDADVLDKFGPTSIVQISRAWAEMGFGFEKTIEMLGHPDRRMSTITGQKLSEPLRPFNQQFAKALQEAYEPYREKSS